MVARHALADIDLIGAVLTLETIHTVAGVRVEVVDAGAVAARDTGAPRDLRLAVVAQVMRVAGAKVRVRCSSVGGASSRVEARVAQTLVDINIAVVAGVARRTVAIIPIDARGTRARVLARCAHAFIDIVVTCVTIPAGAAAALRTVRRRCGRLLSTVVTLVHMRLHVRASLASKERVAAVASEIVHQVGAHSTVDTRMREAFVDIVGAGFAAEAGSAAAGESI